MANGIWRLGRGRSNPQLPLALAAAFAVALLLLGRAQPVLFDRARAVVTDKMLPVLRLARTPVDATGRWASGVGDFFRVYQENAQLKAQNAQLRQWQIAATLMDERVKRYQLLLHAVPDPALSSIVARVIGRASRPFDQTMVLDAGKENGVKPGQAVVDGRGMIGRIFLAGDHTSWVVLITDLNSRIPVTIKPGNTQAILAGDNSPAPSLESLSQMVVLKPGFTIVTSGDGGFLPAGLSLGTLVKTSTGLKVSLLANPQDVDDVEVLDYKAPIETLPAPSVNNLPVAAAGLPPAPPPQQQQAAAPPAPIVLPASRPQPTGAGAPPASKSTPKTPAGDQATGDASQDQDR